MKKLLIIIILAFLPLAAYSQNQWVIYNPSNSGLPSNMVGSILIDSTNTKWIATNNGFVRLRGNTWTVYDTTNSGMPQNACGVVRKDKRNNIWFACGGKGFVKYDGVNWNVYNSENTGLPINWGAVYDFDDNNNKWIVGHGLIKYNDTNWVYYNTSNSGLPTNQTECAILKENILWIGTYMGGVVRFDGQNWTVYNTGNSGLPSNWVRTINTDTDNNLWFATFFGGIAKFNYNQNQWTIYNTTNSGLINNNTYSIYIDDKNIKWIGSSGCSIYNDTTWQSFLYSFIGDVFNFAKDRYGNMWICTDLGLYVYNPNGVVGIKNNEEVVPANIIIMRNYPNPFNSQTKIEITLPERARIKLNIYDINGRLIENLAEGNYNKGAHTFYLNGNNLASGIYFIYLKTDSKIKVHKIVLQK